MAEDAMACQAHPDKAMAEQLFASDPANYPDSNHKPEIAIALTAFEGMCGFRPVAEIAAFAAAVPELSAAMGAAAADALQATPTADSLRAAFKGGGPAGAGGLRRKLILFSLSPHCAGLMTQDAAVVAHQLRALVARLEAAGPSSAMDALILRLARQCVIVTGGQP